MRTTIIPAQITTVEDKIAGSLNFTQILLLMIPVIWATLVYAVFSPVMKVTSFKISLILIVSLISLILAFRFKEKIVAEWIGILMRYKLRPKLYIANKNDLAERLVDYPVIENRHISKKKTILPTKQAMKDLTIKELIKLEEAMNSKHLAVSFRYGKKN